MSISNFKKIYGGGLVIRVDAADGFIYDHKIHNGATIILSDAGKIGALAVDLGNMASNNGATLQIVSTADITITDSKEKLTNVSLSGIGIFNLLSVDGLIYYSDPSNAVTAKLDSISSEAGTPVAAVAAVNGEEEEGVNYSTGTEQPTGVTGAVAVDNKSATFTADTAGELANAYPVGQDVPEGGTALVWSPETTVFDGGVDGTPGKAGKILFDNTNIYIATVDCTIIDASGWRMIQHEALA